MDTEYGYSYGYSRNPMATAAVVLGVISLFTCLIFYISIPCGAMALLFAILSRGKEPMPGKSRTGIVCGAVGMALSAAITLFSVWTVLTNSQMRAYMERYLQYYLGDSSFDLDKELATMFPALKDVLGIGDPETDESSPSDGSGNSVDGLFPSDGSDHSNDELFLSDGSGHSVDGLFPSDGSGNSINELFPANGPDDAGSGNGIGEGDFI